MSLREHWHTFRTTAVCHHSHRHQHVFSQCKSLTNLVLRTDVYCAIYGKGFFSACKKTCDLLKARGFDVIISDQITGLALYLGAAICAIISACAGAGVHHYSYDITEFWTLFYTAMYSGAIGWGMSWIILSIISSGVSTFIVLLAEDPVALQHSHSSVYVRLQNALQSRYPGLVLV